MSWVNDLASVLGIPAGAATLAVAMYAACTAAEKTARPEALKDIGRILRDTTWERSTRPSAVIQRVFVWTFGERHLSWKSLLSSAVATLVVSIFLVLVYGAATDAEFSPLIEARLIATGNQVLQDSGSTAPRYLAWTCVGFLLMAILPDYVSLAKARVLITRMSKSAATSTVAVLVLVDTTLSLIISLLCAWGIISAVSLSFRYFAGVRFFGDIIGFLWQSVMTVTSSLDTDLVGFAFDNGGNAWDIAPVIVTNMFEMFSDDRGMFSFLPIFVSSTLLTSIWTILIFLSIAALKLLAPLQRFTRWFFDVDKHPLRAIGIVAGALVMIGSLIWTVLRAVI